MKTQIIFIISIALLFSCKPSTTNYGDNYEVIVKADGVYDGLRAYLMKTENGRNRIATDTAVVFNGAFVFKGEIKGTEMRALTIDGVRGQTSVFLEPGIIHVELYKDSIHKSKVEGTYNNAVFNDYKNQYQEKIEAIDAVRSQFLNSNKDTEGLKALQKKGDSLRAQLKNFGYEFIKTNNDSDFSLFVLEGLTSQKGFDVELASNAFKNIEASIKTKNESNQLITDRIRQKIESNPNRPKIKIGMQAPDFTAPDPQGKQITLSEIKGKVTIVDFWASWCKPCRIENPNLVKLYDKYHSKGLEIISVSLERGNQKAFWIEAIKKDQLNWYNVSNLKFWQDPIAQAYSVNSIPATFILDENGTVVAERLRGAELEATIKNLLE
ncbi:MAG: TlpA disulfide reductase family protein [Flavobacteriaceae bacterium]|jgi:thiol-disulfide isomerase/thioredoxin|nr:TlpA disulfide reductase family protein [Flavobacteriaceae bacterium]